MSAQVKGVQINGCVTQLVTEMIKQVKTNKLDRVIKSNLYRSLSGAELHALPGYKLLGPHQVIPWSRPEYQEKPNLVVTGFKIKFMGESIIQVNVTAGMILPEVHGEIHKENLIKTIEMNIKERFAKQREQSMH